MLIRNAQLGDFGGWIWVASDVADIFGNPTMANDLEFIDYAERKIRQNEAITAFDETAGKCVGFIGFPRHYSRITWFGVLEAYRNQGIGSDLLKTALCKLYHSVGITVETYRENYIPGLPARHVYLKHGFKEIDNTLFDGFGNERCKLVLRSHI
ncbi:MAG: GNAT family N-acetyltransferase [Oscillospiraceae bacterium]|jgi:GNAT superfamily N-acetyltransferase|nr:GNAT family N-acetyltransferase [Oscillospiraceae bacterium]